MAVLILIFLLALLVPSVLLSPVLLRLFRPCRVSEVPPEWLNHFSPSTYYPMKGLLAQDDFRFLASQPGFDLKLYRKLRRERMHIFRQYLRRLVTDFNRLHAMARLFLAQGDSDQSALVSRLFLLRVRFSLSVVQAEFSYLLCYIGFQSLAIHRTILHLEAMTRELQTLSSNPAAASA